MVDMWPVALGLPAFLAGVTSSALLGVIVRSRRFDELSLTNFAVLGGIGGLIVGLLPAVLTTLGLVPVGFNLWPVIPEIVVPFTLVGAIVGPGTLALARLTEDRQLLEEGQASADGRLTSQERRELLEDST
jgi:hypothetical protein